MERVESMKNESWLNELLDQRPHFEEVFKEYINVIKREKDEGDNIELFYIEEDLEYDMKNFFKYQAAKDVLEDIRSWIDEYKDLDSVADGPMAAGLFFLGVAQTCFEKIGG